MLTGYVPDPNEIIQPIMSRKQIERMRKMADRIDVYKRQALDALQNARGLPLERWLIAFGIPLVGEVVAKALADTHPCLLYTSHEFLRAR